MRKSGGTATFFCDTAVIVAAADAQHVHHPASVRVVGGAEKGRAFCSTHSVAETYAVLTSRAYQDRMRLADVVDVLERLRSVFTVVDIAEGDYFRTIRDAALRETRGGRIYDALHLAAAARVAPDTIYTWNLRDFRALAPPELAERVRTPEG